MAETQPPGPGKDNLSPSDGVETRNRAVSSTLQAIEAKFADNEGPSILKAGRHLMKQAKILKQGKLSKAERVLMLFNDVMLICKPLKNGKILPKELFPLDEIQLDEDVSRGLIKMKHAIKVKRKSDKEEDFVVIGFEDEDTREMWVTLIGITAQSYIKKQRPKGDTDEYGWSCSLHKGNLHWSVFEGNLKTAQTLLSQSAEVDLKNNEGATALHIAVSTSNNDMVKLLLEHKAAGQVKDNDGHTALHLAIDKASEEITLALINSETATMPSRDGEYPLETALKNEASHKVFKALLEAKADPSKPVKGGSRSVSWAALNTQNTPLLAAIFALPKHVKPALNERDSFGLSPFHLCADSGYTEGLAFLLDKNAAGVGVGNSCTGETPLHSAARGGQEKAADMLVAYGAKPNARDDHGNTPLHVAQSAIKPHLVRLGCHPSAVNQAGITASSSDLPAIAAAEAGRAFAIVTTRLTKAISEGDADWQPNESTGYCTLCERQFTMFQRRHHCRACGTVICAHCSSKSLGIEQKTKPVRVCDVCFNKKWMFPSLPSLPNFTSTPKIVTASPANEKEGKGSAKTSPKILKKNMKKLSHKERAILRNKNIQTKEGKRAFREAMGKKYGIEVKAKSPNTSQTKNLMSENLNAMALRGEELNRVQNETEQMANEAQEFGNTAKLLRQKMQKRWI